MGWVGPGLLVRSRVGGSTRPEPAHGAMLMRCAPCVAPRVPPRPGFACRPLTLTTPNLLYCPHPLPCPSVPPLPRRIHSSTTHPSAPPLATAKESIVAGWGGAAAFTRAGLIPMRGGHGQRPATQHGSGVVAGEWLAPAAPFFFFFLKDLAGSIYLFQAHLAGCMRSRVGRSWLHALALRSCMSACDPYGTTGRGNRQIPSRRWRGTEGSAPCTRGGAVQALETIETRGRVCIDSGASREYLSTIYVCLVHGDRI